MGGLVQHKICFKNKRINFLKDFIHEIINEIWAEISSVQIEFRDAKNF